MYGQEQGERRGAPERWGAGREFGTQRGVLGGQGRGYGTSRGARESVVLVQWNPPRPRRSSAHSRCSSSADLAESGSSRARLVLAWAGRAK